MKPATSKFLGTFNYSWQLWFLVLSRGFSELLGDPLAWIGNIFLIRILTFSFFDIIPKSIDGFGFIAGAALQLLSTAALQVCVLIDWLGAWPGKSRSIKFDCTPPTHHQHKLVIGWKGDWQPCIAQKPFCIQSEQDGDLFLAMSTSVLKCS